MSGYVLIESRDPFESNGVAHLQTLARGLAAEGAAVTMFLVQNGVLAARVGANARGLNQLAAAGITIFADDFSLRERAISPTALSSGIAAASMDMVIDRMANGCKILWH